MADNTHKQKAVPVTVRFSDVAGDRAEWTAELPAFNVWEILRELNRSKLFTNGPDVWMDEDRGRIWVYGKYPAGEFEVVRNGQA